MRRRTICAKQVWNFFYKFEYIKSVSSDQLVRVWLECIFASSPDRAHGAVRIWVPVNVCKYSRGDQPLKMNVNTKFQV